MLKCDEKENTLHGSDFHFILFVLTLVSYFKESITVCIVILKSFLFYISLFSISPDENSEIAQMK